jgi:8-oxo-dGTP pyrophosphatase MutT (NUDIX family)
MSSSSLPSIFIGSTRESVPIAEAVQLNLQHDAYTKLWAQNLFRPGSVALEDLLQSAPEFDFAVLIWAPDDTVTSRTQTWDSPRDNLVFEAGLFYGVLGSARVFLLIPDQHGLKIPSDLAGITPITYRLRPDGDLAAALGPACTLLKQAFAHAGVRARPLRGLEQGATYFSNLEAAEKLARADCASAETIAILCNRGLVLFGTDESIVSLAHLEQFPSLRKIRVLLMSDEAPWINEGFISLRTHESAEVFKEELKACHIIVEKAMERFARNLRGAKSGVRYHTDEPKFRLLLTNEVAYVTSYADPARLQVGDLPVYRFARSDGSLYAAFKRHFDDIWHNHSRAGSYQLRHLDLETSAGGIVVARLPERTLVLLLCRHDGYWVLPKGHRKKEDSDMEETALREVSEEAGIDATLLTIERNLGNYTYDETAAALKKTKLVQLYLMRLAAPQLPVLRPQDHPEARWWPVDGPMPELLYSYQKTFLHEVLEHEKK